MALGVLLVCTGNVCRSPMAERLLAAGLARRAGDASREVRFTSAGTHALVGSPVDVPTAREVARLGGDPHGHTARLLTEELLSGADVVLALTRAHRSAVVAARPRLLRRAFTLREAGRLAQVLAPDLPAGSPRERLEALVAGLPAARGRAPVADPAADDVVDPYGQGAAVLARCTGQLLPAVTALLDAVAPER